MPCCAFCRTRSPSDLSWLLFWTHPQRVPLPERRELSACRIGCRLSDSAACPSACSVPKRLVLIAVSDVSACCCPPREVDSWPFSGVALGMCGIPNSHSVSVDATRLPSGFRVTCGEASADRDTCVQRWLEGDMKQSAASCPTAATRQLRWRWHCDDDCSSSPGAVSVRCRLLSPSKSTRAPLMTATSDPPRISPAAHLHHSNVGSQFSRACGTTS
jgi:hypothetical protein